MRSTHARPARADRWRRVASGLLFVAAALLTACEADPIAPPETGTRFVSVVAGDQHTCALAEDGTAYCWGSNTYGQLGSNVGRYSAVPTAVAGGLRFDMLTAGYGHTCGLTRDDRRAYCWGFGADGRLGHAETTDRAEPVAVEGGLAFRRISAGHAHTCGIATTGIAYCWGNDDWEQLGNGPRGGARVPEPVGGGGTFAEISAGHTHTCATGMTGIGYCWGDNAGAQLGLGTFVGETAPVPVASMLRFARIAAGFELSCAVTTDAFAYCWGVNHHGGVGRGEIGYPFVGNPTAVAWNGRLTGVSVGAEGHACAVDGAGRVFCWGMGADGRLGTGSTENRLRPAPVELPGPALTVSAGLRHSCALLDGGAVSCWGYGGSGQLGTGETRSSDVPVPIIVGFD